MLFEDKFYQEIHEGLIRILLGFVSHHQLPMIVLNSQREELNPQAIQGLVFLGSSSLSAIKCLDLLFPQSEVDLWTRYRR